MPWSSQPTPYASAFMAPPAWPIYMPSYMPRPPTQPPFMQAQFEELARQRQDLEAPELEVLCMSRTHDLNAVRDARVRLATSVRGSKCIPVAIPAIPNLFGGSPSGIEVISTGISQTVASTTVTQDGASQNVEAMVRDLVKSSLTQLGVIPQETPDQSRAQSDTVDPESPQIEDISSEGEIFDSDQEDHSGTPVLNELLMAQEELESYDSFPSPVVTKAPLGSLLSRPVRALRLRLKLKQN